MHARKTLIVGMTLGAVIIVGASSLHYTGWASEAIHAIGTEVTSYDCNHGMLIVDGPIHGTVKLESLKEVTHEQLELEVTCACLRVQLDRDGACPVINYVLESHAIRGEIHQACFVKRKGLLVATVRISAIMASGTYCSVDDVCGEKGENRKKIIVFVPGNSPTCVVTPSSSLVHIQEHQVHYPQGLVSTIDVSCDDPSSTAPKSLDIDCKGLDGERHIPITLSWVKEPAFVFSEHRMYCSHAEARSGIRLRCMCRCPAGVPDFQIGRSDIAEELHIDLVGTADAFLTLTATGDLMSDDGVDYAELLLVSTNGARDTAVIYFVD